MTLSYCGETVRTHDPDRFLLSFFAPPDKREALWALYAFNCEIARTRAVVSETQLGLIRLQWWRDALKGGVRGNPVVDGLEAAIEKYGLPRELFDDLIYAREFDLEDRLPANMAGLVNYARFISEPLMVLSAVILSETKDLPSLRMTAGGIATAFSLISILRATPALLRQRRCYLPEELLTRAGIDVQELYEGKGLEKMKTVVAEVVSTALPLLASAPHDRFIRLHAALARMYLKQIESAGCDLFSLRLSVPPFAREIRLLWEYLR